MVKAAPNKVTSKKEADDFANKANYDIKGNSLNAANAKRGNPRPKSNKTVSISLPLSLDSKIDEIIALAAKKGIYGITRSDVVVAALTSSNMTPENAIKEILRVKNK